VWPVLLGGAGRDDHLRTPLNVLADLPGGALGQESRTARHLVTFSAWASAIGAWLKQATLCAFSTSSRRGTWLQQTSTTRKQRVAKRQRAGMSTAVGISPVRRMRLPRSRFEEVVGTAESSAWV